MGKERWKVYNWLLVLLNVCCTYHLQCVCHLSFTSTKNGNQIKALNVYYSIQRLQVRYNFSGQIEIHHGRISFTKTWHTNKQTTTHSRIFGIGVTLLRRIFLHPFSCSLVVFFTVVHVLLRYVGHKRIVCKGRGQQQQ